VPIVRSDDAREFDVNGIRIRGVSSPSRGASEITAALVEFGPGQSISPHTHDHEEVVHVLSGRLSFLLDGEEAVLEPGDTAIVSAGSTHSPAGEEPDGARIVSMMPVGTVRIEPDGHRSTPPWGE
jgi:quercetin dioxygenase-like cupin family protein